MRRALVVIPLLVACAPDRQPAERVNLRRPTEMAFTCHGDLRLTGGDVAEEGDDVIRSAQPLTSCQQWVEGAAPEGQGPLQTPEGERTLANPSFVSFVLQPVIGTVSVVTYEADPATVSIAGVADADPLAPGRSSIAIGDLPIDVATTPNGCHLVSANAGSCDMSALDVGSALDTRVTPAVTRRVVKNADGEAISARPSAMVAPPPSGTIGVQCPDQPEGLLYVAYPDCDLVAVVDAATETVVAGLTFDEQGSVTITDGAVSCDAACTGGRAAALAAAGGGDAGPDAGPADAGVIDAGGADGGPGGPDAGLPPAPAGEPITLHMATIEVPEGGGETREITRLFIGSVHSPVITVVQLGDDFLPQSTFQIPLSGDIGIRRLAASPLVAVGGDNGQLGAGIGASYQYVYAVATDGTVRVAEVQSLRAECDTAVDPRFLRDERDVTFLACMPVGDPSTPPRRPGRDSPGIVLPSRSEDGAPHPPPKALDVAFAAVDVPRTEETESEKPNVSASAIVGVIAFVTASDGQVYIVNVDDDNYPDFEDPDDPLAVSMSLAVPHQPRDILLSNRDLLSFNDSGERLCSPPQDEASNAKGPRISGEVVTGLPQGVSEAKLHLMPYVRQLECSGVDADRPVSELSFMAPVSVREDAYPDLVSLPLSEAWNLVWEGTVSNDQSNNLVDGPRVRAGYIDESPSGGRFVLNDAAGPFCRMGVEDYDFAVLRGCDASRGDSECGLGETCYVHPDTPPSGVRGMCLPSERVNALSGPCRDLLVSRRRYAVHETHRDHLVLGPRRRKLSTTPPSGCTDDAHCQTLFDVERSLSSNQHPNDLVLEDPEKNYDWVCEPDPSRSPGPDQCLMRCETSAGCEPGYHCSSGGFCTEGPLPPAQCVEAVQRYEVRVGEAFAVIGSKTGFLHHRIVDPDTGMCVDDPDGNPLMTGRLPLEAPPCEGDEVTDLTPNPCSTTVEQALTLARYADVDECAQSDDSPATVVRETDAVRFRNPLFTFHLADTTTRGDARCLQDLEGEGPRFKTVTPGFQLNFTVIAGFLPMIVNDMPAAWPARILRGPAGQLWVVDSGDRFVSGLGTIRGQLFHLNPGLAGERFGLGAVR